MKIALRLGRTLAVLFVFLAASNVTLRAAEPTNVPLLNQRVLWIGDSITSRGLFVTDVEFFLRETYPEARIDIVEVGRPSETTSGLSEKVHPGHRPCVFSRLQRALDLVKPQLVVACYGMNDGIYHPQSADRMAAYQAGINKLIDTCHAAGAKVILLTPPPFDPTVVGSKKPIDAPDFSYLFPYEGYDSVLADYAAWEMTLPSSRAQVIDIHTPMLAYIMDQRKTNPKFSFVQDGIHPNPLGHVLMAEIILKALGVQPPKLNPDLNQELAQMQGDPLYALVAQKHSVRSDAWFNDVAAPADTPDLTAKVNAAEAQVAALQDQIAHVQASPHS